MLSWKVFLISAAVIFAALGLKASVPVAAANLPLMWSFFLTCFTPPYLFVIVNAIIISIVASSRFHHSNSTPPPPLQSSSLVVVPESPPPLQSPTVLVVPEPQFLEVKAVLVNGSTVQEQQEEEQEQEEEEEKKVIDEEITAKRTNSTEILSLAEKPPLSARFTHRKFHKSTSEGGRALRVVAKAKRHETLENTWKAITEGRSMPLSRHIRKSDTWQSRTPPPENNSEEETFEDAVSTTVSAGRLRKEPSLSQDELNRRVEAFIRKFNDEMRLQRQQSLEQYMQMINRGAA